MSGHYILQTVKHYKFKVAGRISNHNIGMAVYYEYFDLWNIQAQTLF